MRAVNDRLIAQALGFSSPTLSDEQRELYGRAIRYCEALGLSASPMSPAAVASILKATPQESILQMAAAIAAGHDEQDLANPVATYAVRQILEQRLQTEPPRSWSKEDRVIWASLDPMMRMIITRREQERDAALRRAQNKFAEQVKQAQAAILLAQEHIQTQKEEVKDELQRQI
jgi:hypothetical protein